MWPTLLSRRLGIQYPLFLAPMAGPAGSAALVAAVSEAGGLGSFGGGYLAPEALRAVIRDIRARTTRPFGVNLFIPEPPASAPREEEVAAAAAVLDPIRRELGLAGAARAGAPPDFAGQLAVVKEEQVPVFSFTFGALPAEEVRALHDLGAVVLGSATTVAEARLLEASGVDAVVAQGAEAGGHRGTFAGPFERGLVGTMALVPQVVDAVRIPVVAAGGIMDGRGVAAAFALGASAAQLGTAFLACPESAVPPVHREALLARRDEDGTRLTRAYSGKLVRGFATRFMDEVERAGKILPYPWQNAITTELRQAAAKQGRADLASMWAGQGAPLATAAPAAELFRRLVEGTERVAKGLGQPSG